MRNAVIVGYKRSPFTFARKGEMANIRPEDILSQTINPVSYTHLTLPTNREV